MSEKVELRDLGVRLHYVAEKKPTLYSGLLWIVKCILAQAKSSLELMRIRSEVDIVVFYMANPFYLIPVVTSKLLGKRTIDVITRSISEQKKLLTRIFSLQDPLLLKLFDGLSPETSALIGELKLAKYQSKLLAEGARFIDIRANYGTEVVFYTLNGVGHALYAEIPIIDLVWRFLELHPRQSA